MKESSNRIEQEKGRTQSLQQRLEAYPAMQAKFEALLDVVENAAGDLQRADEAEARVIEELRPMGQQALQGWAECQQQRKAQAGEQNPAWTRAGKKNSTGTRDWGGSKSRRVSFGKADEGDA